MNHVVGVGAGSATSDGIDPPAAVSGVSCDNCLQERPVEVLSLAEVA